MADNKRRRLPSELTDAEARAEGERLRDEMRTADRVAAKILEDLDAADRRAAPLLQRQLADQSADKPPKE